MSTSSAWTRAGQFRFHGAIKPCVSRDNKHLIFVTPVNAIYKFDAAHEKFTTFHKWNGYCPETMDIAPFMIKEDQLFLYSSSYSRTSYSEMGIQILSRNICTNKQKSLFSMVLSRYAKHAFLWVENDIHIIASNSRTAQHAILSLDSRELSLWKPIAQIRGSSHIYLKQKGIILLFGYVPFYSRRTRRIPVVYEYSLVHEEWQKVNGIVGISSEMNFDEAVVVAEKREDFIFIFQRNCDEIILYDVQNKRMKVSRIKCPEKDVYHVMIVMYDDKMVTFGFINECYRNKEYEMMQKLPCYLMDIVVKYVNNDILYLLSKTDGNCWKLSVDKFL